MRQTIKRTETDGTVTKVYQTKRVLGMPGRRPEMAAMLYAFMPAMGGS